MAAKWMDNMKDMLPALLVLSGVLASAAAVIAGSLDDNLREDLSRKIAHNHEAFQAIDKEVAVMSKVLEAHMAQNSKDHGMLLQNMDAIKDMQIELLQAMQPMVRPIP